MRVQVQHLAEGGDGRILRTALELVPFDASQGLLGERERPLLVLACSCDDVILRKLKVQAPASDAAAECRVAAVLRLPDALQPLTEGSRELALDTQARSSARECPLDALCGAAGLVGQGALPFYQIYFKELTIVNGRAAKGEDFPPSIDLIARGIIKLDALITHVVPIAELGTAMEMLTSDADHRMKIILENRL